jgi:cell division protein FtsB
LATRWLQLVLVALIALLAFLQYRLWWGEGGRRSVGQQNKQVSPHDPEDQAQHQRQTARAAPKQ